MNQLPLIGVTVGDPAGIGPEIALKAALASRVAAACRPLIIGSADHLRRTASVAGINVEIVPVSGLSSAVKAFGELADPARQVVVLDVPGVRPSLPFGVVSAEAGAAAHAYIRRGVELSVAGDIGALVTGPIHKVAFREAGLGHLGHTELLAEMTGSPWSLTMFMVRDLRVVFLTRHLSLRDAIDSITVDKVVTTLERIASVQDVTGLPNARIAVGGINPHLGDGGMFGDEDTRVLVPAVALAQERGVNAIGPIPGDAVYGLARQGRYDIVLAPFHDIGAGVCKAISVVETFSLTLGLPFLRFSVDHGTAFDIAGKGVADAANTVETILAAARHAAIRSSAPSSKHP